MKLFMIVPYTYARNILSSMPKFDDGFPSFDHMQLENHDLFTEFGDSSVLEFMNYAHDLDFDLPELVNVNRTDSENFDSDMPNLIDMELDYLDNREMNNSSQEMEELTDIRTYPKIDFDGLMDRVHQITAAQESQDCTEYRNQMDALIHDLETESQFFNVDNDTNRSAFFFWKLHRNKDNFCTLHNWTSFTQHRIQEWLYKSLLYYIK